MLRFGEVRERIQSLEQQLRTVKSQVDVAKSKAKIAMDGESYVVENLRHISQQLSGKTSLPSMFEVSSFTIAY